MRILDIRLICTDDAVGRIEDELLENIGNESMLDVFFLTDINREATEDEIEEGAQILLETEYCDWEVEDWRTW